MTCSMSATAFASRGAEDGAASVFPTFGAKEVVGCRPTAARPCSTEDGFGSVGAAETPARPGSMEAEGCDRAEADFDPAPGTDGCGSTGAAEAVSASPMASAASIGADSIASAIFLAMAVLMKDHAPVCGPVLLAQRCQQNATRWELSWEIAGRRRLAGLPDPRRVHRLSSPTMPTTVSRSTPERWRCGMQNASHRRTHSPRRHRTQMVHFSPT